MKTAMKAEKESFNCVTFIEVPLHHFLHALRKKKNSSTSGQKHFLMKSQSHNTKISRLSLPFFPVRCQQKINYFFCVVRKKKQQQ
jgi:hypothetical protein